MIAPHIINKIKETANIVEVISEFVTLKKRGSRYVGLCPFHHEKTPSFTVTPSLNIFKCFGCGLSGDSISFLMQHEKLSYPEALKFLAQKYHIEIEEITGEKKQVSDTDESSSLLAINSFAQKFFTHQLFENDDMRAFGYAYLKNRGLSDEIIRRFQLGYAPAGETNLIQSALASGFTFEQLQKAGLVTTKNNTYIDFFRDRVMFPIHNMSGKVIAFGGRTLKKDSGPKYINTPETTIYQKSQVLYGLYQAKNAIRKANECILCEGYLDVITLSQAGIENVVASSGTSLTPAQIKLIRRFTENITILYDGDIAGIKAALKGIDLILEENMNVRILLLPDNEDPDSYVRKYGAQQLLSYKSQQIKDFIMFKAAILLQDIHSDPIKKTEALKEIVSSIALIPDPLKRSMYIRECNMLFDIDEQLLINEINKMRRNKVGQITSQPAGMLQPLLPAYELPPQSDVLPDRMDYLEKDIIRLLLQYAYHPYNEDGYVIDFVLDELEQDNFRFQNTVYQIILNEYQQAHVQGRSLPPSYFLSHTDESVRRVAIELLNQPFELSENWSKLHGIETTDPTLLIQKDLQNVIYKLKIELINKNIRMLDKQIKDASEETEIIRLLQIKKEFIEMKKYLAHVLGISVI